MNFRDALKSTRHTGPPKGWMTFAQVQKEMGLCESSVLRTIGLLVKAGRAERGRASFVGDAGVYREHAIYRLKKGKA